MLRPKWAGTRRAILGPRRPQSAHAPSKLGPSQSHARSSPCPISAPSSRTARAFDPSSPISARFSQSLPRPHHSSPEIANHKITIIPFFFHLPHAMIDSPTTSNTLALSGMASQHQTPPKQRNSSFSSQNSPWFRRNSFLSPSMIKSENYSIYESTNYFSDSTSYNIILLKECQGFIFNQDLFASPYQQLKALANEKRFRALSFSLSSANRKNPVSRRHTSHLDSRPALPFSQNNSSVFSIDTDDEIEIDNEKTPANTEAVVDEYEEYEPVNDYGTSNRMYKVHVAEIVVNEDDDSIFPS